MFKKRMNGRVKNISLLKPFKLLAMAHGCITRDASCNPRIRSVDGFNNMFSDASIKCQYIISQVKMPQLLITQENKQNNQKCGESWISLDFSMSLWRSHFGHPCHTFSAIYFCSLEFITCRAFAIVTEHLISMTLWRLFAIPTVSLIQNHPHYLQ